MLYDALRGLRKVISFSTVSIFFQDIFFSLIVTFATFTYLLSVTNGELRGFVFVGITLGFFISRVSLSLVLVPFLKWIFRLVYGLVLVVSNWIYTTFDHLTENILKICQKSVKNLKKLLKNARKLLYTKLNRKV